jgi:hypothetical protein
MGRVIMPRNEIPEARIKIFCTITFVEAISVRKG